MNKDDLQRFRHTLQEMSVRLLSEIAGLREEALAQPVGIATRPIEQGEMAGHEAEENRARAVLTHEESILDEVTAALKRIEDGTFGRCSGCSRMIGRQRLDAVPYSQFCISCAEKHESGVT